MKTAREIRRRVGRMSAPILGTLCMCYFVWHAFHGDYGILAWLQLRENVAAATALQAETSARRAHLEKRVGLLAPSPGIDQDMLDERTRVMTGLARPRDVIILLEPAPAGPRPESPSER